MRRCIYICAALGMLMAVVELLMGGNGLLFVNQAIPILGIYIGEPLCAKRNNYTVISFFAIWITIYNILYVVLKMVNIVDLYNVPYRIPIQLGIPFMVAIIARNINRE